MTKAQKRGGALLSPSNMPSDDTPKSQHKQQQHQHDHHKHDKQTKPNDASLLIQIFELVACTLSIYVIYLTYGLYYEKITRTTYDGERFPYSTFLTTVQCFGSSFWALILISIEAFRRNNVHKKPSSKPYYKRFWSLIFDQVPKQQYFLIAVSYSMAMLSSTAALNYLSYLIQALAKSSKLIPVMFGKWLRGHKYTMREYFHVLLITGGIVLFIFDPKKSSSAAETSLIGIALVVFSLAMDTITGPTQDEINQKYKPAVSTMTFWINIIPAFGFYFFAAIVTNEWNDAVAFLGRHPEIQFEIFMYCFLAAIGQSVILIAILKFNSMTLTIITTTRKFFSILASVFWFGHTLEMMQWAGVIAVFAGIGLDSHLKYMQKRASNKKQKEEQEALKYATLPPTPENTPKQLNELKQEKQAIIAQSASPISPLTSSKRRGKKD